VRFEKDGRREVAQKRGKRKEERGKRREERG
jgi:hypothetical protein